MTAGRFRLLCCAFLAALPAPGLAAVDAGEKCNDPAILQNIVERYSVSQHEEPRLKIQRIASPRLRYRVQCEPLALVHDQCSGQVIMSDGSVRKLFYTVERQLGLISRPDIVRFCISGAYSSNTDNKACATFR